MLCPFRKRVDYVYNSVCRTIDYTKEQFQECIKEDCPAYILEYNKTGRNDEFRKCRRLRNRGNLA